MPHHRRWRAGCPTRNGHGHAADRSNLARKAERWRQQGSSGRFLVEFVQDVGDVVQRNAGSQPEWFGLGAEADGFWALLKRFEADAQRAVHDVLKRGVVFAGIFPRLSSHVRFKRQGGSHVNIIVFVFKTSRCSTAPAARARERFENVPKNFRSRCASACDAAMSRCAAESRAANADAPPPASATKPVCCGVGGVRSWEWFQALVVLHGVVKIERNTPGLAVAAA